MRKEKKEWVEPELIVLVRSKPEEAVLLACKTEPGPATGGGFYSGCSGKNMLYCGGCLAIGAS